MDDATAVLAGQTKKYNIPLSHFEYKYIQNCKDGKELERIYKELIGGEVGSFPDLEKLTLDRIRDVKPNSQILRQDKAPLDRSALPANERQDFDDFLNQMKTTNRTASSSIKTHENNALENVPIRSKSTISKSITPTPKTSVITNNGKPKRIVPRSSDEWAKLDRELNSDNEADADDDDDNEDEQQQQKQKQEEKPKSQRLQIAEQHRLNGNTAFKSNNYQQSIDYYTKSIMLDQTNSVVYMNRAIAYYKLNKYDDSMVDCTKVLSNDPHHIKALYRRASCYIAKQQYDEARCDLDILINTAPDNAEAKTLLQSIPKSKGVRIPITEDDDDDGGAGQVDTSQQPMKIPIMEVDEEDEEEEKMQTNENIPSNGIDIPQKNTVHPRPCIDSHEASPAMYDSHFHHRDDHDELPNALSSHLNARLANRNEDDDNDDDDDDDDVPLGGEASGGLIETMSDDDVNGSRSLNVSSTSEGDDDNNDVAPELVNQKPLQTPPITPIKRQISHQDSIDQRISYGRNDHSSTKSYDDLILNSNFCSTIQNWLRDSMNIQSNHQGMHRDKPWTKSARPWALDRLQRDIERFHRLNDHVSALEASKKMLKNGFLDYHQHAEHIVNILNICAQSYSKINQYYRSIQYSTEALQFNRTDSSALICRAKAFENETFLLLSYADYARIPSTDLHYQSSKTACDRLSIELKSTEGDQWRAKLPKESDGDDACYLLYTQTRDNYTEANAYDWYRQRGNQLYLDACFVLAIRCYTHCIQLRPDVAAAYANRAACYLKVFEPRKALDDCKKSLNIDSNNVRALYRKACAHKMLADSSAYQMTLEDLIKLQPNNQTILAEYFSHQNEQIPRKMRRLRSNPTDNSLSTNSNSQLTTQSTIELPLTYNELEEIRAKKTPQFTAATRYQFTQQLDALKSDDMKNVCSFILRLPTKGLFKVATNASVKLIEMIVLATRTMINAEKQFQQEHKSTILPFSYLKMSFDLLIELTTLPRLDSNLLMIDQHCRAVLDDLLTYAASISTILNDVSKLERLRK